MFRSAALFIVLTLALGPTAGLVCQVSCDRHEVATTGCHQDQSLKSVTVTARDSCCEATVSILVAFVREDARRRVSAPATQHVDVVSNVEFTPSIVDRPPARGSRDARWVDTGRRLTSLRI